MSGTYGQEPVTALLSGTGELSTDYELQHILSVASAYLDAGHIHDADELLLEALEADPKHPGVQALASKLAHVKGAPAPDTRRDEQVLFAEPDVLVNFTAPLPGTSEHSPAIQRLIRATEQYYSEDRVYSAFDLTQVLCSEQPDYIPGYVRLAELQISLGMVDQARGSYDSLKHYYSLFDEPVPWLVESLRIALNPTDTSALIGYAMTLIEAGEATALDPFVPEAIDRALAMNAGAAVDMARSYLAIKPDDSNAKRMYLKVAAASGDEARFIEAARSMVSISSDLDLLIMRLSAEILSESDEWIERLEQIVVQVRKQPHQLDAMLNHLDELPSSRQETRVQLSRAVMLLAGDRWQDCLANLELFECGSLQNPVDRFTCAFSRAICLSKVGDPVAAAAMFEAAQLAYDHAVEPFACSTKMFGTSANPSEILKSFSSSSGDPSVDALTDLRDSNPDHMDIRMALADAFLRAGSTFEGVKELRHVAEKMESAGNLTGMIDAMRRISQAVPTNIEIKAKLIDGYLRRGILDEAVEELDRIGDLYCERNRIADAVSTFTRAAEIASALGKFDRGNSLFDRAVNADPDNVSVRHAAVAFYLQTGSIGQATDQLREVVRIALDGDDRDEAVAALHQIIALAPQDAGAYHKLGEVLTSLGEYTQAERVYRRLASFTPNDPVLEAKQSALAVLAATH